MNIFRRSLLREVTTLAVAVCVVLLGISLTTVLIRLLGKAASGALQPEGVVAFLGFSIINYLPIILSLTLFISVLMTLSRWYSDSEMIVWFSSGVGLMRWLRPVLYIALPVALIIAVLSMGLSPWALRQSAEYQRQLDSRDDVSLLAPGVFRESKYADRVFFIDAVSTDEEVVNNIFVQSTQQQRLGVMVAKQGVQKIEKNGDKFLLLENGRRYDGTPGSREYKVMNFERYALRIEPYEAKMEVPSAKSLATPVLLRQPSRENLAELHWRIGLPLSAVLLALIAIPLSFVNPRSGRSLNLVNALLIYMIYSSLLSTFQAWVVQGKLHPAVGLWPVHVGVLILLFVLFLKRHTVNGFGGLWPWRRRAFSSQ
ncbi:MAG: LPS export ABC transporter permease LptF [Burkholderiales bacterium]|nr:LPS export ABC transporter permease LptF [Burkholderiales bacterium]